MGTPQRKTMNDRLHKLVSDIVESIDYDIWKQEYNEDTAEVPVETVRSNREDIISEIKSDLSDVFEKAEMLDALLNQQRINVVKSVGLGQERYQYLNIEMWTHYLGTKGTDNETMLGRSILSKFLMTHAASLRNEH